MNKKAQYGTTAAIIAMLLDQLHKFYMLHIFNMQIKQELIVGDYLNLVMVWNRGISFGMFQGHAYSNYFFMAFTSIIVISLFFFMRAARSTLEAIAFGIVIGGALGNLIDRIRLEAVADFFDFHYMQYHWPAFNVADSCVFTGAVILIGCSIFKKA